MGQRNMMCTPQMFDMKIEKGHSHLCPEPSILSGNMVDFTNPNIHPVLSSSGNNANSNLHQFTEHNDSNTFYGNQYNNLQRLHPISNLDLGYVSPPNFYNPCMVHSSSSRFFPVLVNHGSADQIPSFNNHGMMGVSMDEYGRHDHFIDNVGSCKRKNNTEGVPGNYYHASCAANSSSSSLSLSLNSGLQNWDESYETSANPLDTTAFTLPEHTGGVVPVVPMTEGSQRSVRSRPSAVGLQLESSLAHHHNHLLQVNYTYQSFQPAGNIWVEQFGSNVGDGGSSNRNYTPAIPNQQGRSLNAGSLEIGNMARQGFQDPSSSRNSMVVLHPPPLYSHHQHLPPVQGLHGHSYSHRPQVAAPSYGHPVNNNLHHGIINPSRDALDSGSIYPRPFPSSTAEWIYRPPQWLTHVVPESSDARMRIISPEDIAVLEFSGFYGVGNFIDQHRDMRLDIDGMSYEELLALEERIGDVNTGLSEESIIKNLKTRIHVSHAAFSLSTHTSNIVPGNGTCIICQVEYEENERIGTLDCGHDYHADCIRQWLLLKNLCPICKTSGLAMDKREG